MTPSRRMFYLLIITLCVVQLGNSQTRFSRTKYSDYFTGANSQWFKDYLAVQQNNVSSIVPQFQNPRAQGKLIFLTIHLHATYFY